jgi:hypothetical protein
VLLAICTCKEALLRASPMEATYVAVKGHDVWSSPGCETWKLLTWKVESEICNFDCVSLCMWTRLRWIIVVSYCFARTKCCNETHKSSVSISLQRLPHYSQTWKATSWRRWLSYTCSCTQKIVNRVSIHPSRSIFVRCYPLRNSGQCYCRRFFVRFWHFWTYEIKSIVQIRCR